MSEKLYQNRMNTTWNIYFYAIISFFFIYNDKFFVFSSFHNITFFTSSIFFYLI